MMFLSLLFYLNFNYSFIDTILCRFHLPLAQFKLFTILLLFVYFIMKFGLIMFSPGRFTIEFLHFFSISPYKKVSFSIEKKELSSLLTSVVMGIGFNFSF